MSAVWPPCPYNGPFRSIVRCFTFDNELKVTVYTRPLAVAGSFVGHSMASFGAFGAGRQGLVWKGLLVSWTFYRNVQHRFSYHSDVLAFRFCTQLHVKRDVNGVALPSCGRLPFKSKTLLKQLLGEEQELLGSQLLCPFCTVSIQYSCLLSTKIIIQIQAQKRTLLEARFSFFFQSIQREENFFRACLSLCLDSVVSLKRMKLDGCWPENVLLLTLGENYRESSKKLA